MNVHYTSYTSYTTPNNVHQYDTQHPFLRLCRETGTPHDIVLEVDASCTLVDVHGLFIESIRQNFDNDVVGELYNSFFFFASSRYALPSNITVNDLLLPYRALTIADASHVNPNIECDIHLRLSPFPSLLPRPKAKRNHSMSVASIS